MIPIFTFLVMAFGCLAANAADVSWLTEFKGKYSYDVLKDQRAKQLINQTFSAKKCDGKYLIPAVINALSGPGEPVDFRSGKFVTVHACKRHACNEIAMVWANIKQGKAASVYTDLTGGPVYISSNDFTAKNLDSDFKRDLDAWMGKIHWSGKKPPILLCGANEKTETISH